MTRAQLDLLATYNAEVARGIVHTAEWKEQMAALQSEYDQDMGIAGRKWLKTNRPWLERMGLKI